MTISSKPALAISTPETGSNTLSPIKLNASATPFRGRQITGWYVYLDNVAAYHSGPMNSVDVNVAADPGLHTLLVRCWDTSGAYGDQAISIAVEKVAVNVSTPRNGASELSPVNIQASANSHATITGWHVYVDSTDRFAQTGGTSINTGLSMPSGSHKVLVRAWDNTGAYGDQNVNVTIP